MELNKDLIPKGMYCDDCPYFSHMRLYDKFGKIQFPYCLYLNQGSMPNGGWKKKELGRLSFMLKIDKEKLWDHEGLLGADLLWDGCKECGVNNEIDERDLS